MNTELILVAYLVAIVLVLLGTITILHSLKNIKGTTSVKAWMTKNFGFEIIHSNVESDNDSEQ